MSGRVGFEEYLTMKYRAEEAERREGRARLESEALRRQLEWYKEMVEKAFAGIDILLELRKR